MLFNRYEGMVRVAERDQRGQERPVCVRCNSEVKSGEWVHLWVDLRQAGVTKLSPVCTPCDLEARTGDTREGDKRDH